MQMTRLQTTGPLLVSPVIATVLAAGLAIALLSIAPSAVRAVHGAGQCGPTDDGDFFACGEIVVDLDPDADATIEEVVERQGGNPETDILPLPAGVPENRYAVAVEVGTEEDAVAAYQQDPAVAAAMLAIAKGAAGGASPTPQPMPNTATASEPFGLQMFVVVAGFLTLFVIVVAAPVVARRARRA